MLAGNRKERDVACRVVRALNVEGEGNLFPSPVSPRGLNSPHPLTTPSTHSPLPTPDAKSMNLLNEADEERFRQSLPPGAHNVQFMPIPMSAASVAKSPLLQKIIASGVNGTGAMTEEQDQCRGKGRGALLMLG